MRSKIDPMKKMASLLVKTPYILASAARLASAPCPAMRRVFQIVSGRRLWRGKGVDREYLLYKIREVHRVHKTSLTVCVKDMQEAFEWLPKTSYASEAKLLNHVNSNLKSSDCENHLVNLTMTVL